VFNNFCMLSLGDPVCARHNDSYRTTNPPMNGPRWAAASLAPTHLLTDRLLLSLFAVQLNFQHTLLLAVFHGHARIVHHVHEIGAHVVCVRPVLEHRAAAFGLLLRGAGVQDAWSEVSLLVDIEVEIDCAWLKHKM